MMKKTICFFLAALCALAAAGQPVERIYVSTDKAAYVAGDRIWCSLFCVDASGTPALSEGSSLAYLELVPAQGASVTGKISLVGGRGAGSLAIPPTLPTGNYALVAYTARNRNEEGRGYLSSPKVISVFNTLSTDRVPGAVEIRETPPAPAARPAPEGGLTVRAGRRAKAESVLPVFLQGPEKASVSVSVYRVDDIPEPANPTLGAFMAGLPKPGTVRMTGDRLPDFDGEVIYATLAGKDRQAALTDNVPMAVVSAQGAASDTYVSQFRDGRAVFFTNNIFGDRDLVCELTGLSDDTQCFLLIESPFLHPEIGGIPALPLSESCRASLQERHAAMLGFHSSAVDTLVQFLPKRENLLLRREDATVYHLDDYVRFPTVREVLVEITPELRVRKGKRRVQEIQMLYVDKAGALSYFRDNILVLLDGIAVTDHARLLEYDALLFEDIEIYPHSYLVGTAVYSGVVNFKTRRGGSLSLRLTELAQVNDFQGAAYPVALTRGAGAGRAAQHTLYWHPAVELPEGEEVRLEIKMPSQPGTYRVVAEGLDRDLHPVRSEALFEVY